MFATRLKRRLFSRPALTTAILFGLGASPPGHTQQAASGGLEEIIVSARLRKEAVTETPTVVTAVTGEMLEQNGITDIKALAAIVPNIHIAPNFLTDVIYIRGIGNPGTNVGFEQQVGLFIDGVYYGNGNWINGGYIDVDSVEVLEGPQGVYFGKNTIAGAFNIKTHDPTGTWQGYVKAGYEAVADERYTEGAVSGPLTDSLGVRLVARGMAQEGWAKADTSGTSEPGDNDKLLRLTLALTQSEDFDANFKTQFEEFRNNGPTATSILLHCGGRNNTPAPLIRFLQGGSASCALNTNIPTVQYTHIGKAYVDEPSYTTALTMHWRNNYGELTSVTGLNRYGYYSIGLQNYSSFDGIDGYNTNSNLSVSEELRYQTKLDYPVNFLGGVYVQHSAFDNHSDPILFPIAQQGAIFTVAKHVHQDDTSKSAFGEGQWKIIDSLELDVAGRMTWEDKTAVWVEDSVAPLAAAQAAYGPAGVAINPGGVSNYNFSPQAILTWKPDTDVMAYVSYRTGFLAGGYNLTTFASPRTAPSTLVFGEEKVKGGEIGTKFYLFERAVQVSADTYYYSYAGLQENVFNPQAITYSVQNAAQSVDKGVELSGVGKLGGGFKLSGNIAYNNSTFENYVGVCLPAYAAHPGVGPCNIRAPNGSYTESFAGVHTSFAPLWAGRVQLDYSADIAADTTLRAALAGNFSDKYIVGDVFNQYGWVRIDANLAVDYGAWTTALIGRNLGDVLSCGESQARPLTSSPQELRCVVDRGREVRLEASYRF
jgi:outer membrane receptor protein involved in Fe transport